MRDEQHQRRIQRILTSQRQHEELARNPKSGEWSVAGERSVFAISEERVLRDFGDEALRRAEVLDHSGESDVEPRVVTHLVSRRLRELPRAVISRDDDQRFEISSRGSGVVTISVEGPRYAVASHLKGPGGRQWIRAAGNHLGVLERVVAWLVAGEPDLPRLDSGDALVRMGAHSGLRVEWEPDCWIELPDRCGVLPEDIIGLRAMRLPDLLAEPFFRAE